MRMTLTFDYDEFSLTDLSRVRTMFNHHSDEDFAKISVEFLSTNDKLKIQFTLEEDI